MGGRRTFVSIEPSGMPSGGRRAAPRALHKSVTSGVCALLRRSYSPAAFRSLLQEYLPAERRDAEVRWSATDQELCWDFSDKSGECSGSSVACAHIWSIALTAHRDRWNAIAAKKGWRIVAQPTPSASLLLRRTESLMSLEHSRPYVVWPLPLGRCEWDAQDRAHRRTRRLPAESCAPSARPRSREGGSPWGRTTRPPSFPSLAGSHG